METYKKPVIVEKAKVNNLLVEGALAVGFLTGLASDFEPHTERQRVITERKAIRD
ncbi:MAG: hypothetical protein IKG61_04690 [Selenomonadaceae bacterium]|nr:hypothetical protein [Selenomonadaceae bacterium]MBR6711423.1 hypothetical protein [Selenomonadaceae bacterium]